ncbi:MAG: PAS domain S-box protein [Alphaproteobacteria bacterium]|nr:PAS domain S-box protein [Alphaproteobacteria bacterium]
MAIETQVVQANLDREFADLTRLSKTFSWYDIAVEKLLVNFDRVFARDTIAYYLHANHGVDFALVVDASDRDVFLAEDGRASTKEGLARVAGGLGALIAATRSSSADEPEPATVIIVVDGAFYLAAASAITPQYNNGQISGQQHGVLILAHRLSPDVTDGLGETIRLSGLGVVDDVPDGMSQGHLAVASADGSHVKNIVWVPRASDGALMGQLWLPLAAIVLAAVGLLIVFLRRVTAAIARSKDDARHAEEQNRALDASERRTRAIFDNATDGVVVADERRTISSINAPAERLFGASADLLVGRPFPILLAPIDGTVDVANAMPDTVALESLADHSGEGSIERRHVLGRRWNGGTFVLEASVARSSIENRTIFIAILRDVTEARRAEETLNLLAAGMILVGEGGHVLLANRSAEQILACGNLLRREGSVLRAAAPWNDKELQALIARALAVNGRFPLGSGAMNLYAAPGMPPVHAVVTPLRMTEGTGGYPVAAIMLRDSESQTEIRPELLRQLYGLTKAESRVVTELARGKRLSEVAAALNVSVNTVRNQLKQAFAKTSTNRQTDLVSLVLTSVSNLAQVNESDETAA